MEVMLGFMTAAWLFTVGGGVYAFWRYAYKPDVLQRKAIEALLERLVKTETELANNHAWVKNELGLHKAMSLSNEELAIREARVKARRLWPSMQDGSTA